MPIIGAANTYSSSSKGLSKYISPPNQQYEPYGGQKNTTEPSRYSKRDGSASGALGSAKKKTNSARKYFDSREGEEENVSQDPSEDVKGYQRFMNENLSSNHTKKSSVHQKIGAPSSIKRLRSGGKVDSGLAKPTAKKPVASTSTRLYEPVLHNVSNTTKKIKARSPQYK